MLTKPVEAEERYVSTPQAAFIGVAAMVGAGIFSLLGAAGELAGAAVWISFLIAGFIAALQGYSFAKLGARYPSAGGLLEYLNRGFGQGHVATVIAWLTFLANGIITAMVAVSFGSYASAAFADGDPTALKAFAAVLIILMTLLNVIGSRAVARVQTLVVTVVIGILITFAVVTLANMNPELLDPAFYPGRRARRRRR
jgi:amino acid transporter